MEDDNIRNRAKWFCSYFVEDGKKLIDSYLSILEGTAEKKNSTLGTYASTALGAIPKFGNTLEAIVSNGDKYIVWKIETKTARSMAKFIYRYKENKDPVIEMLGKCAFDIFISFEEQMSMVFAKGGFVRAMQKMAMDSVHRFKTYYDDNPELLTDTDVKNDDIAKGILYGKSISKLIRNNGKTLIIDSKSIKSSNIFSKVGLCVKENGNFIFYNKVNTSPNKYGYRQLLPHENHENIDKEIWTMETHVKKQYQYELKTEDYSEISKSCSSIHKHPKDNFQQYVEQFEPGTSSKKEAESKKCQDELAEMTLNVINNAHKNNAGLNGFTSPRAVKCK